MSDDLLDTVSKALALHDEAHHRLVCECVLCDPNTQLRGWLRSLLARCREAETALADLRERDHVLSKHLEDRATARDPLAQSLIAAEAAALERAKTAEAALAELREQYDELIFAVGSKWPGETRHQAALRYILQAEAPKGEARQAAQEFLKVLGEAERRRAR